MNRFFAILLLIATVTTGCRSREPLDAAASEDVSAEALAAAARRISLCDWNPRQTQVLATVEYEDPQAAVNSGRRLAVFTPDGRARLLTRGFEDSSPSWSPSGDQIAFTRSRHKFSAKDVQSVQSSEADPWGARSEADLQRLREAMAPYSETDLYVLSTFGPPFRARAGPGFAVTFRPVWLSDGMSIAAFTQIRDVERADDVAKVEAGIWVGSPAAPAGGRLIHLPDDGVTCEIAAAPVGAKLAGIVNFLGPRDSQSRLYILDVPRESWQQVQLPALPSPMPPHWTRSDEIVVLQHNADPVDASPRFMCVDTATLAAHSIVPPPAPGYHYGSWAWAESGKAVALSAHRLDRPTGDRDALFIWYVGATSPTQVAEGRRFGDVLWSPDGTSLAAVENNTHVRFISAPLAK